jgi:peptidoglycan/xylan/chitin deacetylase (PgdA/CDA1 family)
MPSVSGAVERATRGARSVAGRTLPAAVILAYHRVASPTLDPQLLCVAPDVFVQQLAVIARLGTPLSLGDLVRAQAIGRVPRRAIVLTFDDGYADNLLAAEPLLAAAGVPATVFVTTGGLESGTPFWWDQLEALLLRTPVAPERLEVRSRGESLVWHIGQTGPAVAASSAGWDVTRADDPTPRHTAYRELSRVCRALPPTERSVVIAQATAQFDAPASPAEHRRLSVAEVRRLAASGVVTVGAHGVWHAPFAVLTPAQQREELWGGRQTLTGICGQPVDLLAYPFGASDDLTRDCVALAHECGFAAACANQPGRVTALSDPYQLPRFLVRNWGAAEFAARLESWLPH